MLGKVIKCLLGNLLIVVCMLSIIGCSVPQASKGNHIAATSKSSSGGNGKNSGGTSDGIMDTNLVEPTKVFDNLYYLGDEDVGAWIVNTSKGIILIDSMNNNKDAKDIIVGGMKKLGFDPANIKYVLVTHGHLDHYGGAQYIHDNYGATILMTTVDWNYMNSSSMTTNDPDNSDFSMPTSYKAIIDGEKLILGDTTITIVSTPGHTPGGVSLIIPVTDNGIKHIIGMWGGTELPLSLVDNKKYLNSLNYFAKFTDAAKVDAEITAHPFFDNGVQRMKTLRNRKTGDPNPFVIGQAAYKAYMDKIKTRVINNIKELEKKGSTQNSMIQ